LSSTTIMPKKTEPSAVSVALTQSAKSQQDTVMLGIEDFELPRALVVRIAKSELPDNVKIGKDASLGMTKAATVFINYLTATALDIAKARGLKTITTADVLKAMEVIEFGDQVASLEEELEAYREGGKKSRASGAATKKKGVAPKDESAYKGKVKLAGIPAPNTYGRVPAAPGHPSGSDGASSSKGKPREDVGDGDTHIDEGEASEPNDEQWDTEDMDEQDMPDEDEEEEEEAVDEGQEADMMITEPPA